MQRRVCAVLTPLAARPSGKVRSDGGRHLALAPPLRQCRLHSPPPCTLQPRGAGPTGPEWVWRPELGLSVLNAGLVEFRSRVPAGRALCPPSLTTASSISREQRTLLEMAAVPASLRIGSPLSKGPGVPSAGRLRGCDRQFCTLNLLVFSPDLGRMCVVKFLLPSTHTPASRRHLPFCAVAPRGRAAFQSCFSFCRRSASEPAQGPTHACASRDGLGTAGTAGP